MDVPRVLPPAPPVVAARVARVEVAVGRPGPAAVTVHDHHLGGRRGEQEWGEE